MLALTAALVGPYFVDWTSYRSEFERQASAVLGRQVTVEGAAKARLLPFPSVSFSDVRVAGGEAGQPAMTVESFSMDAELAPFLSGEVLIFDMRLVKPRAVITVAEDGRVNWAVRPSTPFDARDIAVENLTIEDGQIVVRHAVGGREHLIADLDASVSARSLAGPWRLNGSLVFDGVATTLAVSTGEVQDGRMRLRVQAAPSDYPVAIETDGDARIEDGAAVYGGRFSIAALQDEHELIGDDGETAAGAVAETPDYRVAGQFTIDHRLIGIDEFRLETGPVEDPYTAEGTAFIDIGENPRFAVKADGAQVRLDESVQEGPGALTLEQRIDAVRRLVESLPNPTMPGTVEVNLPAIVAGDTTIRSVHLSAEPADNGWVVNSLAATLPGRTTLEANGFLTTGEDFGFSGSLLLAVGQPSGFAAWVSKDVDEAIRRLPAAGFSAEVEIAERRQSFRDLELVLGAAKFEGEVQNLLSEGARPTTTLRLDGGELDLDGLTAFASLFVSDEGDNRFAGRDLDFEITAGPVHAGGLTAETVDTALRLKEGRLDIDRLSIGGLAGASVSATGAITGFPAAPAGDLDASLVAVDLEPLVSVLAERYPSNPVVAALKQRADGFPGFFQDASVNLVASAVASSEDTTGLAVSAQGKAAGTRFTVTGSAKGSVGDFGQAALRLDFAARNEDAGALMALYALPAVPLEIVGAGETSLSMQGTVADGLQTSLSFSGADLRASFEGIVQAAVGGAQGTARLEAGDVEPWLMTAGLTLPGMGLGLPVTLQTELAYRDGTTTLSGLDGTVADGAVAGDLKADLTGDAPHLSGALALDALDLQLAAAAVLGEAPLQSDGEGLPETPFAPSPSKAFTAELDLTAGSIWAGPIEAADARLKARLDADGLRVADLDAALFGGRIGGLFELRNNGGTGLLSAQLRLDGAALDQALPGDGIAGRGEIAASLTASGKSVSGMAASLSGSGTASVRDLVVAGVNPRALAPILARADRIGRDINAAATAAFAPAIARKGTFRAPAADLAFTVAGGVLRAPPLTLRGEEAAMTADIRADLAAGTIQVTGEIAYQPGEEALVGSEPAIGYTLQGPIGAAEMQLNTEPLAQFLTQRALEKEQARVEAMQANLLEQQRLRRETRYFADRQEARQRREAQDLQVAQERRRREDAQARVRAEEEARVREARRVKTEARAQAEAEARRLEEEARLVAEAEARRIEEERLRARREAAEQRAQAEAEARQLDEEARLQAEAEARRLEEEARLQAEAEAQLRARARQAAAEQRARAEAQARRIEEEARLAAEETRRIEEERLRAEAEARAAEEARLRAEEAARLAAEAEARRIEEERLRAEAEARAAEEARLRAEEAARLAAEAEARRIEEARAAEEEARLRAEEARLAEARRVEEVRLQAEAEAREREAAAAAATDLQPLPPEIAPVAPGPRRQPPPREEPDALPGVGDSFKGLSGFFRSLQ